MTPHALARTLFAVLGVYFFVDHLIMFVVSLGMFFDPEAPSPARWVALSMMLVPSGVGIAAGCLLVALRTALANRLVGPDDSGAAASKPWALPATAFALLGAYFFVAGVSMGTGQAVLAARGDSAAMLAASVAYTVAGIALFLGAHRLASLGLRARSVASSGPD